MKRMKFFIYMVLFFIFISTPMKAHADIGPKPSVVVEFEGIEEEEYYVTLLSERDSTGPWSVGNDYYDYMGKESVFQMFCEYEDKDGYYFLSFMEDCSEDDTFEWTYYPPNKFKILIYFPEYDAFFCDENIYERYAFDSYFTVAINSAETFGTEEMENVAIHTEKSYDFTLEIVSLIVRVVMTIAIEIVIALLFAYRNRKALTIIAVTNVCTQLTLNVLLNVINYQSGHYAFVFHYIWMECVVFVIEGFVYSKAIGYKNPETDKEYHPYWYAAVSNLASLIVGIWIAKLIPGIF